MAEHNPFDQASRYVARLDPPGLYSWLLDTPVSEFKFVRWIDTRTLSFPGSSERTGDLVGYLEQSNPPGQPWLVPLEIQIEPDPLMFGRLLEYCGRLWRSEKPSPERGDRFWLATAVINLTGTGRSSQSSGRRSGQRLSCKSPSETYRPYRRVRLWLTSGLIS